MNIVLAESAGFCFGVNRAVEQVYSSAKEKDANVYTLGQIIHNNEVTDQLEKMGVQIADGIDNLPPDCTLIIRSHGVGHKIYQQIDGKNIKYIDMTCPYVKKIHKIVQEHCSKNFQIIIVGDPIHPEVIGINGWCDDSAVIINSLEDCKSVKHYDKICIVAQTTFSVEKWGPIRDYLINNCCNEYVEFCTICAATDARQKEVERIAGKSDAVIVIGGKHSSNTRKLYDIAQSICPNSYLIETAKEIDLETLKKYKRIGITAGASTPKWIIKEVLDKLNTTDNNNENLNDESMESFDKLLENSFKRIETGTVVQCEVIRITDEEVIVNFGHKSDGVISKSEFTNDPTANLNEIVKLGETFEAMIIKNNDGEGNVVLSKKRLDIERGWENVEKAYKDQSVIMIKVVSDIKGGAIGVYESQRVFIPISQLSNRFVSDVKEFIGKTIPARIIKLDERKQNIVASSRVVLEESKEKSKVNFWEGIHIGKDFLGKVKRLASFGAFVDIGNGIDGLLHISEISWNKQDNPQQYMNVDDEIEVYVKEFDKEKEKVVLGLKNKPETPWAKVNDNFSEGDVVEGKIVRFAPFGAFLEVAEGIQGLVHISQISDKRISKPEEILELDQRVKAKITSIDVKAQKMSLSIKEVAPINHKGEEIPEEEKVVEHSEDFNVTLGDAIKIKTSDEE